jgi:hypothetical protein
MKQVFEPIVRRIVSNGLKAGYTVSVNDGGEWTVKKSTKRAEIVAALFSTDSDTVRFRDKDGKKIGDVFFVYNFGDPDVVNDHSDNPEIRKLVGENFDGKI